MLGFTGLTGFKLQKWLVFEAKIGLTESAPHLATVTSANKSFSLLALPFKFRTLSRQGLHPIYRVAGPVINFEK